MIGSCDLVIIGGGPAGSTLGCLVKKYNPAASVILVERLAFPRHHIGESLLAAVAPVLKEMGVFEKIEAAGFPKKMGATYVWGKDSIPWNADFARLSIEEIMSQHGDIPEETPYAWQVLRSHYDAILLDHAKNCGVEVVHGSAENILEEQGRVVGVVVSTEGGQREIRTRLLADCSGQSGFLSVFRKIREIDPRLKNVAAYAYFRGARWRTQFTGHPDKTRIFVCSVPQGWIWYIPISQDVVSVGLVTTYNHLVENGIQDIRAHYSRAIQECPEIADLLQPAKWIENFDRTGKDFFTIRDWSYLCRDAAGEGWLAVGDAAVFVDPIFSSGVTVAHLSAQRAACTITTIWKGVSSARECTMWKDYSSYCRETASRFLVMALTWYDNDPCQQVLWERAKRMYQARLPEQLSGLKAYVAVVSGFLSSVDSLIAFNLDNPAQDDFYRGVWKDDSEFVGAINRPHQDEDIPRLVYPFLVEPCFVPESGSAVLKTALRMKFIKHETHDPVGDVFNPRMLATPMTLKLLRKIDGRRSLGEIKVDMAVSHGIDKDLVARECQRLLRQLDVWETVEYRNPVRCAL
ncbi:MAG: tryptophan 7-halogenase [Elusimicrobia bacterium]|nr:tryptophan 7-halogenase [Elusimicrobiota bacterium]